MGLIRFLLALSVLIVHSSPVLGIEIIPGSQAVHSFYIISGFYMAMIFVEKYEGTERPLYYFFSNRILRLYPLYLLVVILIVALSIVLGILLGSYGELQYYIDKYNEQPNSLGALITVLFLNISLIGQDIITFFGIDNLGHLQFLGLDGDQKMQELLFIPIAWTVSIELFFYLLTPFIVAKKKLVIVYWLLAVIGLRLLLYMAFDIKESFAIYRFAPTELFWFLLGVLSYKLFQDKWLPDKRYGILFFILLVLALFTYKYIQSDWLIFILVFLFTPSIFYRLSSYRYDRYLGELTYPLYISHCLFLIIISANRFPKQYGTGLPLVVMTLTFSVLAYHYFLQPIDRFRATRIKVGKYINNNQAN
jgi:peptidoglycan/LPS O-acetylase OafA/YrhL